MGFSLDFRKNGEDGVIDAKKEIEPYDSMVNNLWTN